MPKVNTLPDCFNSICRRWDTIYSMCNGSVVYASKTNKRGKVVQLIVSENGKKREMIYPNSKIMHITDANGNKRVYVYRRDSNGTIKGKMITIDGNNTTPILIRAASWLLKNFHPQNLSLKINPQHPNSDVFIPVEHLQDLAEADRFFGIGKKIKVSEVLAKDFETDKNISPKTIEFRTTQGKTEIITVENSEENEKFIRQFRMRSDILGEKIMTVV